MKILRHTFYLSAAVVLLAVFWVSPSAVSAQAATEASVDGVVPKLVVIPHLNLVADVEPVGKTTAGAMDVPSDWQNVAWYEPGYAPGETGRAVLAAHLDWSGNAGPFWGLEDMPVGSLIGVAGEDGRMLIYKTTSNLLYGYQEDVTDRVFGLSDESRLSLITCEGEYLPNKETYDGRRVLEAVLVFDSAA